MTKVAIFSVSYDLLHDLLSLPETCQIVRVVGPPADGFYNQYDFEIYVESAAFPDSAELPHIKPIFERCAPVVLKDWGFPDG